MTSFSGLASYALAAVCLFRVMRGVMMWSKYPSAPGPRLAAWTNWWYLWKVWEGSFEAWEMDQHANHGKVVRIGPKTYSIDDPDAVKIIYSVTSPMAKSNWYTGWGEPGNENIFSSVSNTFHGHLRRMVANLYSMASIKSYEPYVDSCITALFAQFDRLAMEGSVLDLQRWMQCYAFDVIGEITYGQRIGFMDSGGQDVDGIMHHVEQTAAFGTFLGIDFRLLPILLAKYGAAVTGIFRWDAKLTKLREAAAAKGTTSSRSAADFCTKLDMLEENNPEQFRKYHCVTIKGANLAAGSDTTSITLTTIFFNLAKNETALRKLKEEIQSAAAEGRIDQPITFDQAQKLPYLQAVIKEGLRIHPGTGLPMWRVVPKGGATISSIFFPPGSIVGINSWTASYNKSVFGPDPSAFRPERWLPEFSSAQQLVQMERYFLTFGAGPHSCLGKHLSMMELAKLIPELIRRYEIDVLSQDMKYLNRWFVKQKDVMVRLNFK